ncbi:hypothetical protein PCH_Pc24g02280 [Penicillium rubens Wisconsin 54-1255]|uniref:Uncharacterized protein n=1 Tax=Penicillium rubens (strain ATCC 28089 / DSM 1075 / NRRL 1951 / Wisconsin 54-1255) TaxID=500485 RepID=B6HX07_PENRW|nr:hypothetical protein PCH_Pc24g02280 [Penicillium rubens Wisconsin 54-1255]
MSPRSEVAWEEWEEKNLLPWLDAHRALPWKARSHAYYEQYQVDRSVESLRGKMYHILRKQRRTGAGSPKHAAHRNRAEACRSVGRRAMPLLRHSRHEETRSSSQIWDYVHRVCAVRKLRYRWTELSSYQQFVVRLQDDEYRYDLAKDFPGIVEHDRDPSISRRTPETKVPQVGRPTARNMSGSQSVSRVSAKTGDILHWGPKIGPMKSQYRVQREYNHHGKAWCRGKYIALRTFYRLDRQRAACHLTGELLQPGNTTTDRAVAYHSVAKAYVIFQILTVPAVPPKQQCPVPTDIDSRQHWARESCLDRFKSFQFLLQATSRTPLTYSPVGRRWDLRRRKVPASV